MDARELYIGLMSGTSADCIDAAVIDFAGKFPRLLASHGHPLDSDLKRLIHQLATPGDNEIDRLGVLDVKLGKAFAEAVNTLLDKAHLNINQIIAIGSHGQTIRHRPPGTLEAPFTLQIADPNTIAQETGITTVADFRRRDMAAGGQGAPLAPAFHQAVFHSRNCERMVVNIGGISNITHLPRQGEASGYDTGPGNALMDAWILRHRGETYDRNGLWGASGDIDEDLLQELLKHPFFSEPNPKSTGREMFNLSWLDSVLSQFSGRSFSAEDVQATLQELTAKTIADGIEVMKTESNLEIFICGGGAHNRQLMSRLQRLLLPNPVADTASVGLPADWVEAAAFAWLARQNLKRGSGNLRRVTGATKEVILGGIYPA